MQEYSFGPGGVEVYYAGYDITSHVHTLAGSIPNIYQPLTQTMVNQWFTFGQNVATVYNDLWIIASGLSLNLQRAWYPDCHFKGAY